MHAKKQEKIEKNDDTGVPQMGEVGCGSLYPTCSLLTCYNAYKRKKRKVPFDPRRMGKKGLQNCLGKKGNEGGGW